jgi:pyruvate,orthophosphate dikinase
MAQVAPSKSIIHERVVKSRSLPVLTMAYGYNALKDKVGLQNGVGTLIDPSYGRAKLYEIKIMGIREQKVQEKIRRNVFAYYFEKGKENPLFKSLDKDQLKTLLGGKGYNLYVMRSILGFPVPATFTLPAWMSHELDNGKLKEEHKEAIRKYLKLMEEETGKKFGDARNPLFVSNRSGAKVSMPGMMETVLNLGLTEKLLNELIVLHPEQERFWLDSYRRLYAMFGKTVLKIEVKEGEDLFEEALSQLKQTKGYTDDTQITANDFRELIQKYKEIYLAFDKELPQDYEEQKDYEEQIFLATESVFASWNIRRAVDTRNALGIPDWYGTAVNVCEMVFGNKGPKSATGVLFTHDNNTGEKEEGKLYGYILFNAQGEDVVAGVRDALPLEILKDPDNPTFNEYLQKNPHLREVLADSKMKDIYWELYRYAQTAEEYALDMQDMEFTIEQDENGVPKLWMLQTRDGGRSGEAAIKIAVDLARQGKISEKEAVMRVEPRKFAEVLFPKFDEKDLKRAIKEGNLLGKATAGSLGAGCGPIIFDANKLTELIKKDPNARPVINKQIVESYPELFDVIEEGKIWRFKKEVTKETVMAKRDEDLLGVWGQGYILIRPMTNQDDVPGMRLSKGVLTQTGSKVCHAVIMTTMYGVPCVVGFKGIEFITEEKEGAQVITGMKIKGKEFKEGDFLSIFGNTGEVFDGEIKTILPKELSEDAKILLNLAKKYKRLKVRANTELEDAEKAKVFGAEGVGLVRTEHQFNQPDRLMMVREMFLALRDSLDSADDIVQNIREKRQGDLGDILRIFVEDEEETEKILAKLKPAEQKALQKRIEIEKKINEILLRVGSMFKEDFYKIYEIYDGLGVTSRLLDAPFHEFFPDKKEEKDIKARNELAAYLKIPREELDKKIEKFKEHNPMMGLRSVRFGIRFPQVYEAQIRAMLEAGAKLIKEGKNPKIEIEIPLVTNVEEIKIVKRMAERIVSQVEKETGIKVPYRLGIMVETPAAALSGKEVAEVLGPDGFASHGTNDQTQLTDGYSRDDAEPYLQLYVNLGFFPYGQKHPFLSIDPKIARLIKIFGEEVRSNYPEFEIFVCGEHGADHYSIEEVFHKFGFTGISMSAPGVPPSIMAAAHAQIKEEAREQRIPFLKVIKAGIGGWIWP